MQKIRDLIEVEEPELLSTWFQPDSQDIKDKAIAFLNNIVIEAYKNTENPLVREAFVCVRRKSFLKLGGFDETIPFREGSELLKPAYRANMNFVLYRNPKFICSYRRVRKQGVLRTFINSIHIELARLTNHRISENTSRMLYPMEGGRYFDISTTPLKRNDNDSLKEILRRIFKPLQS